MGNRTWPVSDGKYPKLVRSGAASFGPDLFCFFLPVDDRLVKIILFFIVGTFFYKERFELLTIILTTF